MVEGVRQILITIIGGRWVVVSENLTVEGNLANGRRDGGGQNGNF